jgi:acetyltransferase-like isoleucine patch superfamily enzyme
LQFPQKAFIDWLYGAFDSVAPWKMDSKSLNSGRVFLGAYRFWNRFRGKAFAFLCRGAFHRFGPRSVLLPPIRLGGERFIAIGEQVFVGPGSWLQVMAPGSLNQAPVITIGDETSITGFCTVTAIQSVVIEPSVLMARYVYISDHAHAHGSRERAIKDQGCASVSPVRICEGAWLGQGVVVCPGVTIGRNAVVGANSVVRHDVPDFCVAAGVPAKIIRRVDQDLTQ